MSEHAIEEKNRTLGKRVMEACLAFEHFASVNRRVISHNLKLRGMPLMWHEWNKFGQIHRIIYKDFGEEISQIVSRIYIY